MIIKVCGMMYGQNIRDVERLQPDMMGFICWEGSKRNVAETPDYLPDLCRVGVFVDPTIEYVIRKKQELGLNRIQLHGSESAAFCQSVHEATGLPIIKAISVNTVDDIKLYHNYETTTSVDLLLFDTKCKTYGGSGERFDWDILLHYDGDKPFLLAGGIGPDDVRRVLSFRHPRFVGIDLNSRFEVDCAVPTALSPEIPPTVGNACPGKLTHGYGCVEPTALPSGQQEDNERADRYATPVAGGLRSYPRKAAQTIKNVEQLRTFINTIRHESDKHPVRD